MATYNDLCNVRAYLKGQITAAEKCFNKYLPESISKTNLNKLSKKVETLNPKIDSNYESLLLCQREENETDVVIEIHNQYQELRERLENLEDFLSTAEEKFRQENEAKEREREDDRRKSDEMLQREKLEFDAKIEEMRIEQNRILEQERIDSEHTIEMERVRTASSAQQHSTSVSRPKLPPLNLPKFSGNYDEWLGFRDRFNQAVHCRTDISKAEKLGHLISNLEGKALDVVKSFGLEDANYQTAYDLLKEMFEHKRQIAFKLVDSILDHPPMQSRSSDALLKSANVLTNSMAAIKSLDNTIDVADLLLTRILARKLDNSTLLRFNQTLEDRSIPTFKNLVKFVHNEMIALESSNPAPVFHPKTVNLPPKGNVTCSICKGSHFNFKCPTLEKTPEKERLALVEKCKLCTNCLLPGHFYKNCKSKLKCKVCNKTHNTHLHASFAKAHPNEKPVAMTTHTHENLEPATIKPTAAVNIFDSHGQSFSCRALLDSCSDDSFIQESLVRTLGLTREKLPYKKEIRGLQQQRLTSVTEYVMLELTPAAEPLSILKVKALIIQKVGGLYPQTKLDPNNWKHIPSEGLADPEFHLPKRVQLLLAAYVYFNGIRSGILRGSESEPVAQFSVFGWLVGGGRSEINFDDSRCNAITSLDLQLREFWELEKETVEQIQYTAEEKECESVYEKTTLRLPDGSYQVQLPFKLKHPDLGNSKNMAFKRLSALWTKFDRNVQFMKHYSQAIHDYIKDGHIEEVPSDEISKSDTHCYFLPHHGVVKASSDTTKLRVVFDASARSSTQVSLNDQLLVGPELQQDLFSILVRWRYWIIPIKCDIKQMYLFIHMYPGHRDFLRILWKDSKEGSVKIYRMTKVPFGISSAPYLAKKTLQRLADDENVNFPTGSVSLKRDFYMDDGMTGANTREEAIKLFRELQGITSSANFLLRKWSSSDAKVLDAIPEELRASQLPLSIDNTNSESALGLQWIPATDEFKFIVNRSSIEAKTKRQILSEIAKVFDPLGFLSPITIGAKMLMQKLWKANTAWDKDAPTMLLTEWFVYQKDILNIENIRIPRCISPVQAESYQIHGFADASEKAYAAVLYLRTLTGNSVHVSLVAAKTRVAPTKEQTLPKLELCAALLLAELTTSVVSTLPLNDPPVTAWTDSMISLAWIRSDPQRWKTFVRNRVVSIQEKIPAEKWHHIPGILNPADLPTRGLTGNEFLQNKHWFKGPEFLLSLDPHPVPVVCLRQNPKGDDSTPSTGEGIPKPPKHNRENYHLSIREENLVLQERKHITIVHLQCNDEFTKTEEISCHYSSWKELRRHTCWWIRFWKFHKLSQVNKSPLTPEELLHAEERWIFFLQRKCFAEEIKMLEKEATLPKKSALLSLTPFLQNGLLRVGGRLANAELDFEAKHQLLLPKHHITDLIIRGLHLELLHAGTQALLANIQRRFWIIRGRSQVRKIIHSCKICVVMKAKVLHQLMADLPAPRVRPTKPFTHTGVDYAGPIILKDSYAKSPKTHKAYIAVFVCLCTKAVHLEVVSSLFQEAFLSAFRRFVSRRGRPVTMKSDNGTNFRGANRELQELFHFLQQQLVQLGISKTLSDLGIRWSFIPPAAPHMGGLWESAVKSAKFHINRVMYKSLWHFEEYDTLLKEVEACLNSRPLCPLSSDPLDLVALTPGHFLIGEPLNAVPEPDLIPLKQNRLNRWQQLQQRKQHIWRRWNDEYLQQLQRRTKWKKLEKNIAVGDMVVIREENSPPQFWHLGRVTGVFPDPTDRKLIRVVQIKTANGELKRAVTKLVLLPMGNPDEIE